MQLAEKFSRPIIVFVDTPAAYPGIESEERGVAEAIALNLREMTMLDVPVDRRRRAAKAAAAARSASPIGDRILMQEFAIYSVIPPEGCAAILWRDAEPKGRSAAEALKITAPDLLALGIIDEIVPEPIGGAHTDPDAAAALRRRGALARAGRGVRADGEAAARTRATRSSGTWARLGHGRRRRVSRDGDEQPAIWEHAAAATMARRRRSRPRSACPPVVARLLCQRGLADPEAAQRFLQPVARSPARSVRAGRHARRRSIGSSRAIARRERIAIHGDYDVDGITSTVILRRALELLGADVVHFIPERLQRRLRPAAGGHRAAARRGRRADRLGRLRHPRRRRGAPRARARRRPDHHRPPRAGRRAAAARWRSSIPSATTARIPDKNLAGVGVALKLVQALCRRTGSEAGCRGSSRSPRSARWPTSCRSSARTASSRSSASTCCRAGRTRSACARCSTSPA